MQHYAKIPPPALTTSAKGASHRPERRKARPEIDLCTGVWYNLCKDRGEIAMKQRTIRVLQAGLLLLSAGLIALGACSGEVQTVFVKATKICMECIGLG